MPTNDGSFVILGAIEQKWLARGGFGSPLGHAVSNEVPAFDGVGRTQSFQNGAISWHPETGAQMLLDRVADNFVAEFVGTTNFISGEALGPGDAPSTLAVSTPHGTLVLANT